MSYIVHVFLFQMAENTGICPVAVILVVSDAEGISTVMSHYSLYVACRHGTPGIGPSVIPPFNST